MKVPNRIKQLAERIVKNARKQRELNKILITELEKLGVDVDDNNFVDGAFSYLEGDCSAQELISYLEAIDNE